MSSNLHPNIPNEEGRAVKNIVDIRIVNIVVLVVLVVVSCGFPPGAIVGG